MTRKEIILLAIKYAEKGYNYDQVKYCDDLYGKQEFVEEIMEYIVEYKQIGAIAFRYMYKMVIN
jgi:hypothetical protein